MGVTAIELGSGNFYTIKGKALIIATGGAGRLYSFSTYALSSTPDGLDGIPCRYGIKGYGVCTVPSNWNFTIWNFNH